MRLPTEIENELAEHLQIPSGLLRVNQDEIYFVHASVVEAKLVHANSNILTLEIHVPPRWLDNFYTPGIWRGWWPHPLKESNKFSCFPCLITGAARAPEKSDSYEFLWGWVPERSKTEFLLRMKSYRFGLLMLNCMFLHQINPHECLKMAESFGMKTLGVK